MFQYAIVGHLVPDGEGGVLQKSKIQTPYETVDFDPDLLGVPVPKGR